MQKCDKQNISCSKICPNKIIIGLSFYNQKIPDRDHVNDNYKVSMSHVIHISKQSGTYGKTLVNMDIYAYFDV